MLNIDEILLNIEKTFTTRFYNKIEKNGDYRDYRDTHLFNIDYENGNKILIEEYDKDEIDEKEGFSLPRHYEIKNKDFNEWRKSITLDYTIKEYFNKEFNIENFNKDCAERYKSTVYEEFFEELDKQNYYNCYMNLTKKIENNIDCFNKDAKSWILRNTKDYTLLEKASNINDDNLKLIILENKYTSNKTINKIIPELENSNDTWIKRELIKLYKLDNRTKENIIRSFVKESHSNDLNFFMFELVENKSCPKDILEYFIKNEFNHITQDGKTISQIAKNKLDLIISSSY